MPFWREERDSFSRLCQALLFWRQSRVWGETLEVWEGVRGASFPSQTPIFTLPIIRSFQAAETLAEDKLDLFQLTQINQLNYFKLISSINFNKQTSLFSPYKKSRLWEKEQMNDSLSLDQFTGSVVLSSRLIFWCFTLMMLEIGDIWKIFHYQKILSR